MQVSQFTVLPNISAGAAAAAVLASMVPLLVIVWRHPDPARFACYAALASLNRYAQLFVLCGVVYWRMRSSSAQLSGCAERQPAC